MAIKLNFKMGSADPEAEKAVKSALEVAGIHDANVDLIYDQRSTEIEMRVHVPGIPPRSYMVGGVHAERQISQRIAEYIASSKE